jgi:hypothetical protein
VLDQLRTADEMPWFALTGKMGNASFERLRPTAFTGPRTANCGSTYIITALKKLNQVPLKPFFLCHA